jgi:hypothetical protein
MALVEIVVLVSVAALVVQRRALARYEERVVEVVQAVVTLQRSVSDVNAAWDTNEARFGSDDSRRDDLYRNTEGSFSSGASEARGRGGIDPGGDRRRSQRPRRLRDCRWRFGGIRHLAGLRVPGRTNKEQREEAVRRFETLAAQIARLAGDPT